MEQKINLELALLNQVILSRFTPEMVPKYHKWLQDPFILEATSTEPLSLEELYQICESWNTNPNQYTYIIFDKLSYRPECPQNSMIGDVNIFVNPSKIGEINIMIAEEPFRNKGIASEVLSYIKVISKEVLFLTSLVAKIKSSNTSSQRLFLRSGFVEFEKVPDFEEIHYSYSLFP